MNQSLGLVSLVVKDYDEALQFFIGKLDFELVEDTYIPEQDKRWVAVRPKGNGGSNLLLAKASTPEQDIHIGNQTGGRVFLFLYTDNFWRDYNSFKSKGIEFIRKPNQTDYGTFAVFKDLYGNQWDLLEPGEDNKSWKNTKNFQGGKSAQQIPCGIQIRGLSGRDIPRCSEILHGLPEWFGIEESNRAYIRSLSELPGAVATINDRVIGFIALTEHNPASIEINVLGVDPSLHRQGAGRALVTWAEDWCRRRGAHWFQVKTRGPLTPDPNYELTRAFYLACGFEPLFETLAIWGPENAALVMIKKIETGEATG